MSSSQLGFADDFSAMGAPKILTLQALRTEN